MHRAHCDFGTLELCLVHSLCFRYVEQVDSESDAKLLLNVVGVSSPLFCAVRSAWIRLLCVFRCLFDRGNDKARN